MLKQLEVFMIAAVFVLITAIIIIIYTMQREQEFKAHSNSIQKSIVHGAAYAIDLQLRNKQRHIRLFIDEYAALIDHLTQHPGDQKTADDIKNRLQQRFPDFFTYTITTQEGKPILENIDALVGDACKADLNNFANTVKNKNSKIQNRVFIHPQPFHYHYDIMAPLTGKGSAMRIFFSSFYLQEIMDILKTHAIPGQNLMLVRQSNPNLIEVTPEGARDKLSRNTQLSTDEYRRIRFYENIPGTDWQLVNLPDESFEKEYRYGLWMEAIVILTVVTLALILLVVTLTRLSQRKVTRP